MLPAPPRAEAARPMEEPSRRTTRSFLGRARPSPATGVAAPAEKGDGGGGGGVPSTSSPASMSTSLGAGCAASAALGAATAGTAAATAAGAAAATAAAAATEPGGVGPRLAQSPPISPRHSPAAGAGGTQPIQKLSAHWMQHPTQSPTCPLSPQRGQLDGGLWGPTSSTSRVDAHPGQSPAGGGPGCLASPTLVPAYPP